MKNSMAVVAVIITAILSGAVVHQLDLSNSPDLSSSKGIMITSDTLAEEKTNSTGNWTISLQNTGSLSPTTVTVYLDTPAPAQLCGGDSQLDGLTYENCGKSPYGNPLPPGSTLYGNLTGGGPGSGVVGDRYSVDVFLTFSSGPPAWINSTVTVVKSR